MRRWLPTLAFDRPVSVLMVFLALLVIGGVAWQRIPLQMMPGGFTPSELWISLPFPNGSPSETDEQVVRPVQEQLSTLPGVKELESRASSGRATFEVTFHPSRDMDAAYADVVDRLERAMPELPEEVDRYWIYKYNPDDAPIIWAGVSFPESVVDRYHVVNRVVRPRLERIPGVASLEMWGVDQRAIFLDWDQELLAAHGVSLGDVHRRLAADNFQQSAGELQDRGQVRHVRSLARLRDISDLEHYPVRGDLELSDIARIEVREEHSGSINRINGQDSAALAVMKESAANTVEVSERVVRVLEALEGDSRVQGARFFVFFDQGELISGSIDDLGFTALVGGLFAVVILFLFLREPRMTLLIALSIPFSILITIGVLYFRGDSLNLLALMGLMLAVGMVVDNAIVVVETIYRRRADGMEVRQAAIEGTSEVNIAIILSTLTTMVVFLPIILMSEDANLSFFLKVLGYPVIFALGASLVVALVFAPLATRYIGRAQVRDDARWLAWLTRRYVALLRWVLGHRVEVVVALVALGALTIAVPVRQVERSDSLDGNLNDFAVRFEVPPQYGEAQRDRVVRAFEDVVDAHAEAWGVRVYRSRLRDGSTHGRVYVYLREDGPLSRDEVMEQAEEALPVLPGVESMVGWSDGGSGGGNTLQLSVHGEDIGALEEIGREVVRRVETRPGVLDAELDLSVSGADEVRLRLDREALDRYGVSGMQVGRTVAWAMRGAEYEPLRVGERETPVIGRFKEEDRETVEALLDFPIFTPSGTVPLRSLASVEVGKGPSSIVRLDGRTSLAITVDLEQDLELMEAYGQVSAALEGLELPRGYSWERGERFRQQAQDDEAMRLALLLSVCFVFLLMGVLFESVLVPLAIVTTIPMAMLGALWGLFLTGTPLDTMAGVGLVILVGVVVNNGIVLVDLVTQLRHRGLDRAEALVEAGRLRLRPILMTALTTIFGLVPMALGSSDFIGVPYAPLGRTVIGGLAAATLLTLLFVPFLYAVLDDLGRATRDAFDFARRRIS